MELCVTDALEFFATLSDLNPELFKWKHLANSRAAAARKPFLDLADPIVLRQILQKGRNHTDFGNHVIEDLGFRMQFWNSETDVSTSAQISLLNGCYDPYNRNNLYLSFPSFDELGENDELARRLLNAAVSVLDPEWAILARDIKDPPKRPYLDRGLYVSSAKMAEKSFEKIDVLTAEQREDFGDGVIYLKSVAAA